MQDRQPPERQGIEDKRLRELALEAKHHPSNSNRRRLALNRLLAEILRSNRLSYPKPEMRSQPIYEDIRNEATSKVLLEIAQRIEAYRPEQPVMAWVNELLKWRFLDVLTTYNRQGYFKQRSLDDWEQKLSDEPEVESDTELLRQLIINDPDKRLTNHIRDRPDATLQALLLLKLEELTLEEISKRLAPPPISIQTLTSFLNRNLRSLKDYFQNYLQE